MNSMDVDDAQLPVLNDDVLFEIFTYLSPFDRKYAKSVCKQWLQVSRHKRFADNEVIYISHFDEYSLIEKIIDASSKERFSLRFSNHRIRRTVMGFWKDYGPQIESLQFYQCDFLFGSLPQILSHCVNLRELSVIGCDKKYLYHYEERLNNSRPILRFQSKMQYKNFAVLHLHQNSELFALNKEELTFIASTFPNLRSLKISLKTNSTCRQNFAALLELLRTRFERLETIHVDILSHKSFPLSLSTLQEFVPSNRLKNVSLSGGLSMLNLAVGNASLLNAISYKYWSSLVLKPGCMLDATLLNRVLEELPLLQEFEFKIQIATFENFRIVWFALMRSRLRYLTIEIPLSVKNLISRVDSLMTNLSKNTKLHCLRIITENTELFPLFAKYFCKVADLSIESGKLTSLPWYSNELSSLYLDVKIIESRSPRFNQPKISIESLEFLDIQDGITDLFASYLFVNLKYLNIDLDQFCDLCPWDFAWLDLLSELASLLARESPNLEGIVLCGRYFETEVFNLIFQFVREFRNLRYIYLLCTSRKPVSTKAELLVKVEECCNQCPALKAVSIRTHVFSLYYFYNPMEKAFEVHKNHRYIAESHLFTVELKDLWRRERSQKLGL